MNPKETYNICDSLPEVVQKNKTNVVDLYDIIGNFIGTFVIDKYYNHRDIVVYNGSQYYCIAEGFTATKSPDTDPDNWTLYLAKGQTGETGETGPIGPKGDPGTTIPYTSNVYSLPKTDVSISNIVPSTYTDYELEIFADTTSKFKVFLDGYEAFSSVIYLKLVQTGGPMNTFFVAETENGIHTNNIGGQLKDRIVLKGADNSDSMIVYFCKQL